MRRKRADPPEEEDDDVMDDETDLEDDDEMEVDDDSDDSGMALGGNSFTIPQDAGDFRAYANNEDDTIIGTVGLNSCSGVLIVGDGGAVMAHLNPISPDEGNPREQFEADVEEKVKALFRTNAGQLANAKM